MVRAKRVEKTQFCPGLHTTLDTVSYSLLPLIPPLEKFFHSDDASLKRRPNHEGGLCSLSRSGVLVTFVMLELYLECHARFPACKHVDDAWTM